MVIVILVVVGYYHDITYYMCIFDIKKNEKPVGHSFCYEHPPCTRVRLIIILEFPAH